MGTRHQKIGLALGCGGMRGYAHIGVIKVLEENGIPIDFIAGSSVGALVGSYYALFKNIKELEDIIFSTDWRKALSLVDFSLRGGLIKGAKSERFINKILKNAAFPQLKIPFIAVATDFKTGERVELSEGKVASAVQASIAVPLVFKPVLIDGKVLFDGGVSDSVPVDAVKKMGADIVIAVNLINKSVFGKKVFSGESLSSSRKSVYFLHYNLAKRCSAPADIVIEPQVAGLDIGMIKKLLKGEVKEMISEGEKAARLALPEIKRLIKI
jgi:NTE family protein